MESVIAAGDLSKLPPTERVRYYNEVCRSIGVNPLVQPFSYIVLNGKLTLYATRTCADQLRKINGVSLEIVSKQVVDDLLTVHVRAKLPDGRCDEDFGSVAFPSTLKGEARANAELKAVTKAKRRATLSICGLGWLDETEVADIPGAAVSGATNAISASAKSTSVRDMMRTDRADMGNELTEEQMRALYMELLAELKEVPPDEMSGWLQQPAIAERIYKLPMGWQGTLKRNVAKRGGVAEVVNQATGEVIWEEEGERPATAADVFDGADWLKSLDGAFGGCEDMISLGQQQVKFMTPNLPKALPPDRKRAQELLRDHAMRINKQTMTAAG